MTKDIIHEFSFSHAPEVVWKYLTDSELLSKWLMQNDFRLEVGHQFRFWTKPKYKLNFDGVIYCEVLEVIPFQKLVYSWKGGLSRENPTLDSILTWTLIPTETGTTLRLEHTGFRGLKNYLAFFIMNMGWQKIAKRLQTQMIDL